MPSPSNRFNPGNLGIPAKLFSAPNGFKLNQNAFVLQSPKGPEVVQRNGKRLTPLFKAVKRWKRPAKLEFFQTGNQAVDLNQAEVFTSVLDYLKT